MNILHNMGGWILTLVILTLATSSTFATPAKLLNPYGQAEWKADGTSKCKYLKTRFSFLCGDGDSKNMVRLLRTTNAVGSEITSDPSKYYRRTCLSISYDKEWVTDQLSGDVRNINSDYSTIVYAYSIKRSDNTTFDIYWYTPDDSNPIIEGSCNNLFQNGGGSLIEDVSGIETWDFTGVTSTERMFSMCRKLKSISFGTTVDMTKLTSFSQMFYQCTSMTESDIRDFFGSLVLDKSTLNATQNDVVHDLGFLKSKEISTANDIKYIVNSSSYSFDYIEGPFTNMKIRNLGAEQILNDIKFHWDLVYETNIKKYFIQYSDNGTDWSDDNIILETNGCGDTSIVVSLYSAELENAPAKFNGEKYYRIKYIKTNEETGYSDVFSFSASLLPIELSRFSISQDGEHLFFEWETETETNNDFFSIEQSTDGVSFREVARIAGMGTTSFFSSYEYSLPATFDGITYFRLKQTDYNGMYSYSDVKSVTVDHGYLFMYPIPAEDYITIEGDYQSVKFCDNQGQIHQPTRMEGNTYPLTEYPKGVLYAIITLKNGEIVTKLFIRK